MPTYKKCTYNADDIRFQLFSFDSQGVQGRAGENGEDGKPGIAVSALILYMLIEIY